MRSFPGVDHVVRVSEEYRVLGRHKDDHRPNHFSYQGVQFSQDNLNIFAGLCAVDSPASVDKMMKGNTQNFELLKSVGRQQEFPVLLKRGFGISLDESLHAAEYLASEGNQKVVFGLRGMKTNIGDPHRNMVDFAHIRRRSLPKL